MYLRIHIDGVTASTEDSAKMSLVPLGRSSIAKVCVVLSSVGGMRLDTFLCAHSLWYRIIRILGAQTKTVVPCETLSHHDHEL